MTLAHVHLLLNHVPTVGFGVGLALLMLALVRKNEHLKQASFEVFFVVALLTFPTYMSGVAAQAAIQGQVGVSQVAIDAHQNAALLAFGLMEITGLMAWLGLWQIRRVSRPAPWILSTVVALGLVTFGLMAWAANIGGDIRHPEIRSRQEQITIQGTSGSVIGINNGAIAEFVTGHTWVWPACETLHFVGLCLLFGIVLLVNLRLLGAMKSVPFSALHRLLPWGVLGFAINVVTGVMFFIGTPDQYTTNIAFYWKMGLVMLAGLNALYLTMFEEAWKVGPGEDAPLMSKVVAASAIVLWIGVIYTGRMLPFIGNAF